MQFYRDGVVRINGQEHRAPLIICPDRLLPGWAPRNPAALQPPDMEQVLSLDVSTVLFGTGATPRFPPPEVLACLEEAGIGHETMNTAAACRSYNVLAAEGRRVAAVLLAAP